MSRKMFLFALIWLVLLPVVEENGGRERRGAADPIQVFMADQEINYGSGSGLNTEIQNLYKLNFSYNIYC